jgi:hypothetical protein
MGSKILIVNGFAFDNPISGGQARCFNMRKALQRSFDVDTLVLDLHDAAYDELFLQLNLHSILRDVVFPLAVTPRHDEYHDIVNTVTEYCPDIIWLEHPYLWAIIKPMLPSLGKRPKVVYSSHNIEWMLKQDVLKNWMDARVAEKYTKFVMHHETDLIRSADLIITTTAQDKAYINSISSVPTVVMENGDYEFIYSNTPKLDCVTCCFIGSGYTPNADGLGAFLEQYTGSAHIDIIGNICDHPSITPYQRDNVELHGVLSKLDMDAIISRSDCIIIPVFYGGGSTIKFRQALLTNKAVITTPYITSTFDHLADCDGVYVVNSVTEFNAIIDSLDRSKIYDRSNLTNILTWDGILKSLPEVVSKLVEVS